ncbi:MAG: hypothetical protein Q9227_003597 [Pyrenula ochraceoflavens]
MPSILTNSGVPTKKRKAKAQNDQPAKRQPVVNPGDLAFDTRVQKLEDIALEAKSESSISALLELLISDTTPQQRAILAVSLCKVFVKLFISRDIRPLESGKLGSQYSKKLYSKLHLYREHLLQLISTTSTSHDATFLELYMRTLKVESENLGRNVWKSQYHSLLCEALLQSDEVSSARDGYIASYVNQYSDCCLHMFKDVSSYMREPRSAELVDRSLSMLSGVAKAPNVTEDLSDLYILSTHQAKSNPITTTSLKKAAESAWLAILSQPTLSRSTRKKLLQLIVPSISPWFVRPELLMDFLTDSYNQGGSDALLALSGLYQLISTKNLDYPSFYPKLYSLLDSQLLHSSHRSRFFRLLQNFLSSTHLPATIIASFIKRMARLCLFAPPSAVVAVIPHTYNLLKNNPATTFMIHRTSPGEPFEDPFDNDESDPELTGAIDSSLWELETLQSHYHPNVASIARIISEQFTKQQYNLEDFLDHSYTSMIDAELSRDMKKDPVVEWKIPKRVLTRDDDGNAATSANDHVAEVEHEKGANLLLRLWSFN